MKQFLFGCSILLFLTACDAGTSATATVSAAATGSATATGSAQPTSGPTPTASLLGCPKASASSSTGIVGIGGTIGAFATVHQQDASQPSEFTDPGNSAIYYAACKPGTDLVGSLDHSLPQNPDGTPGEQTEAQALAAAVAAKLYPSDATQTSGTVAGACKLIVMHSAALAATTVGAATGGNFTIELNRPPHDAGPYDPTKVADTLVTTTPTSSC